MKGDFKTLHEALKQAGYETVELCPSDRDGYFDLYVEPGNMLDEKTRNWPALAVVKDAGLKYADVRLFGDRLIFKRIEHPPRPKPLPEPPVPAAGTKHQAPGTKYQEQ